MPHSQKWEYAQIDIRSGEFQTRLPDEHMNRMAKEGWRFIAVIPSYHTENHFILIFEREVIKNVSQSQ
jgi:Domain of unknown function (DUF4177)